MDEEIPTKFYALLNFQKVQKKWCLLEFSEAMLHMKNIVHKKGYPSQTYEMFVFKVVASSHIHS